MKPKPNFWDEIKTRRPVNRAAGSHLWKTPRNQEPQPSIDKPITGVVKITDHSERSNPPPPGVRDKRRWIFGKILVTGYAYMRKITHGHKAGTKPFFWVGDNWNPNRKTRRSENIKYWWCYCLQCETFIDQPIGDGLKTYQKENRPCGLCTGHGPHNPGK